MLLVGAVEDGGELSITDEEYFPGMLNSLPPEVETYPVGLRKYWTFWDIVNKGSAGFAGSDGDCLSFSLVFARQLK